MDAPLGTSDAELVARVLDADREAFAEVYDRYGPRLYDFAYSMLRHREDASDAVADSFVTFAEKLSQLRDPDRLRPWLYAIVRSECLRRLKARKRVSYGDDEQLAAMADESATPEEVAEKAALTQLVWDAAAGLADRDRALLDLHLRQGLEGAELGEAMGTTAGNAYVMLTRLRGQVDRSLGALLIARLGREECDELDAMLVDWDGSFSPLIRKRVARHVDGCTTCGERRKRILSPWVLLAAVPVFVAPLTLRDRVLNDTRLVSASGPPSVSGGGPRWSRRATGTAAAAALVVAASLTTVAVWPDGDTKPADDVVATPTTSATTPAPASAVPTPTIIVDPTPTNAASDDPSAEPGEISVSTTAIDLGTTRTSAVVTVANSAGPAVPFTASDDRSWLSVSPTSGTLPGDGTTRITVRAQRSRLEEGTSRGTVRLTWTGGSATIRVTVRQENRPVVGRPTVPAGSSCEVPVTVRADDSSGLRRVVVRWTGPSGSGSRTMTEVSPGTWRTTSPIPVPVGGTHRFTVTATDTRGNTTTGPTLTTSLDPCPG